MSLNDLAEQGRSLAMLGDAYLQAGRLSDAEASALASLAPLEAAAETTYLARSLRLLAEACGALGETEKARAAHEELRRLQTDGSWSRRQAGQPFQALFA